MVKTKKWNPFVPALSEGTLSGEIDGDLMVNNHYHVLVQSPEGSDGPVHLSIRRNDRSPTHDWRDFQRIKNELCGDEREAIELYPAESRLMDEANSYHLWVLPEGEQFPIGWTKRMVLDPVDDGSNARQRAFGDARIKGQGTCTACKHRYDVYAGCACPPRIR